MLKERITKKIGNLPLSPMRRMFSYVSQNPGTISFASGEPDFDTPVHIKQAIKKALDEGHTHYSLSPGLPELREAITNYYKHDKGIDIEPSQILITVGSGQALDLAISSLIDEGDEVLVPNPGYLTHLRIIEVSGGVPIPYSLESNEEFSLNSEEVAKRIGQKTKAILLCNPGNPTGTLLEKDCLEDLARIATKNNLVVISDEIYERVIFGSERHHSAASVRELKDRTIVVNGFSKTYAMTGLRLGYLIAEKEYVSEIVKWFGYLMICVAPAIQWGGIAALTGPQDCVKEMVHEYDARRRMLVDGLNELDGIRCAMPRAAFYVFPDISRRDASSERFSEHLLKKAGVATVPGVHFGSNGEGHIRLSFATSTKQIQEGLTRLAKLMNQ